MGGVCPELNLVQDSPTSSPEARIVATMSILSLLCRVEIVEDNCLS